MKAPLTSDQVAAGVAVALALVNLWAWGSALVQFAEIIRATH